MIKIDEHYSKYRQDDDPGYPGGKAVPVSAGNKTDGTPWRALWFNDISGFFQSIIVEAYGKFEVSGEPDKVGKSDLLNAVKKIMAGYIQDLTSEAPKDGRTYGRRDGTWTEISGGGGGGGEIDIDGDVIRALKLFSERTLMITNAPIIKRRQRGFDIGVPYLSDSSEVYHFDTDRLNQHQESNIVVTGVSDLVDKNYFNGTYYFTPAVSESAPFEMLGKSLYGDFSLTTTFIGSDTTVDFWVRLFNTQNAIIFRFGCDAEEIVLHLGNQNIEYSVAGEDGIKYSVPETEGVPYSEEGYSVAGEDGIEYSIAEADGVIYSIAGDSDSDLLEHTWQGGSEASSLKESGIEIIPAIWTHIAAVTTRETISCFINNKKIDFTRKAFGVQELTLKINENKDEFNLDEFLFDATTAIDYEMFRENSQRRIPYAALDYKDNWFVLEADNINKVKTNLFETEEFKTAVEAVIQSRS